jgi:hypothetical protein
MVESPIGDLLSCRDLTQEQIAWESISVGWWRGPVTVGVP